MTVIKGTFPVRFRVDGKDGEGLWVRYAVTLDKWDDTLKKSYPSKMYTLPTDDCIYIGIAVGAGNAPTDARYYDWLKFVGVDGQSFIIRGVCEEVYSYDAFYDEVEKVVGKVYLLENYDNEDFNALAVRWTEGGAVDLGAVDGDAYIKSSNRFLFVKNKNRWQSLGSIQGPKGDPGDPGKDGEDAISYKLSSSISALPLNNDGSPQITSFTLSAVMRKGATVVPFDENYILLYYIYHSSDTPPVNKGQWLSSSISSMTVYLTNINDIKNISCSLKYRENNALKTLDSFDILPIKAGAAGVSYFPNMRGYWELGGTYQWQGMSRDMVVWRADGDDKPYLYAVKTAGTKIESSLISPDKDTENWEKADSPFSMLFANFVYTDNASVGGFVYSEEQMRSTSTTDGNKPDETGSNCNILIDGKKGILRALKAEIQGKVIAKSGTFENGIFKNVKMTGSYRNPFSAADSSFDTDYNDNVVIGSSAGWTTAYSLPWDASQSGRRITLVNYKWGSSESTGSASIGAPSGKYFYEDGFAKSSISLSREAVELLGYGDNSTFYGWIVFKRINLMTTKQYGKELKVLAFGTVTGKSTGVSIQYKTIDGSEMSVTKIGVGCYRVNMNPSWFATANDVRVMLTTFGNYEGNVKPFYANLLQKETSNFTVRLSPDGSLHEGSFEFTLYNAGDWLASWKN